MSRLLLLGVLVLAGCSDSSPSSNGRDGAVAPDAPSPSGDGGTEPPPIDTSACPGGVAPTLESCDAGLFDADCGGAGEPVLACVPDWHCKWFAGGCPAEGYRPIECPVGDPFCVATADGHWPFASGVVSAVFPDQMCDQLDLLGDAVVTATSGPLLDVRIDPAGPWSEELEIECDEVGLQVCSRPTQRGVYLSANDRSVFGVRQVSEAGDFLAIELVQNEGERAARAWALQFTDFWPYGEDCQIHTSNGFPGGRPSFTGGEVVLTAEPAPGVELHGQATLVTTAGGTMTLRF